MITQALRRFTVLAFTHKTLPIEVVGKFHMDPSEIEQKLVHLKTKLQLEELMYLSTCNRVEFFMVPKPFREVSISEVIETLELPFSEQEILKINQKAEVFKALEGVKHLFKVSTSLDSMVIGEREIITQVRNAYESGVKMGLTGDFIRLLIRKTIETAKHVFTETAIFKKPVSVVSLGFHRLRELNMPSSSRILVIGAGKTNRTMTRFLVKHGYKNIQIFNRTLHRAEELAQEVGATAHKLGELKKHTGGFDIIVTCTSATMPVINHKIFNTLVQGEKTRKVIIDLAVPGDVEEVVLNESKSFLKYIDIAYLKRIADKNLAERADEIEKCEAIIDEKLNEFYDLYREREVELAMRHIPQKVKEIKSRAVEEVYAKELSNLNPESREVLDKVIAYMEKKYISVPMKMAKEVMLNPKK